MAIAPQQWALGAWSWCLFLFPEKASRKVFATIGYVRQSCNIKAENEGTHFYGFILLTVLSTWNSATSPTAIVCTAVSHTSSLNCLPIRSSMGCVSLRLSSITCPNSVSPSEFLETSWVVKWNLTYCCKMTISLMTFQLALHTLPWYLLGKLCY